MYDRNRENHHGFSIFSVRCSELGDKSKEQTNYQNTKLRKKFVRSSSAYKKGTD
jgi:hypothetical protein